MRKTRKMVLNDQAILREIGKFHDDVNPPSDMMVNASDPESIYKGRKCDHGMYIPPNSSSSTHSEYCTVCSPVFIAVMEGHVYKA